MALACEALRCHRSPPSRASNCAERNLILEASCIDCLRMKRKSRDELGAQEDDRVAEQQAVLGPAEGEDVHACVSGQRAKGQVEGGGGVGEAGAVHVQEHLVLVGELGQGADLLRRVDGAELGGLGDRDDAGLRGVLVADPGEPLRDQLRGELPVGSRGGQELHPRDPLGRPALVDVEVRGLGADHGLVGAGERLEREDVGAGAVEDQERLGLLAEVLAKALGARRPCSRRRRRRGRGRRSPRRSRRGRRGGRLSCCRSRSRAGAPSRVE